MQCTAVLVRVMAFLLLVLTMVEPVKAQCPALPYQLSNGQVGDATQVMANFDALGNCVTGKGVVNSGTAGHIGYYAATGSTISGQSLSALLDTLFGLAQGSILYRSATGWAVLGPGTTGYVLQSGGPGADPSWTASGGGGGGISTIVAAGVSSGAPTVPLPQLPVISRPALSSFSWVNQASATASEYANGPLVLRTTQNTPSAGINAFIKSVAGSDWTVTIQYALGNHTGAVGAADLSGLAVYNSSSGRIYMCGLVDTNSIAVWAYNSVTSWNSYVTSKTVLPNPGAIWTRAQYASSTTTLTFSYSVDGFTWETIYSTNAPFVGVPTDYGIALGTGGNGAGFVLSLNYMTETSP